MDDVNLVGHDMQFKIRKLKCVCVEIGKDCCAQVAVGSKATDDPVGAAGMFAQYELASVPMKCWTARAG